MVDTDTAQGTYVETSFERDTRYISARITADGRDGWPVEPGRYRLVVSRACPWANRAIIVRRLLGLESVLSMGIAGPTHDARSWRFDLDPGGVDPVLGIPRLKDAYETAYPGYDRGITVPAIVDIHTGGVVTNDFRQITLDLSTEWTAYHRQGAPQLYPEHLRDEIISGSLTPGTELNEVTLAESLGVAERVTFAEVIERFCTRPIPDALRRVPAPDDPQAVDRLRAAREVLRGRLDELDAFRDLCTETLDVLDPQLRDLLEDTGQLIAGGRGEEGATAGIGDLLQEGRVDGRVEGVRVGCCSSVMTGLRIITMSSWSIWPAGGWCGAGCRRVWRGLPGCMG